MLLQHYPEIILSFEIFKKQVDNCKVLVHVRLSGEDLFFREVS
jgi:hypothetical protein